MNVILQAFNELPAFNSLNIYFLTFNQEMETNHI